MNEKLISEALKEDCIEFKKALFSRYSEHINYSYSLFSTIVETIEKNRELIKKNLDSDHKRVTTLLFYDCTRIYWGILVLCEDGFCRQAAILLRSLMEKVIEIEWLAKLDLPERERKAKAFLDFEIVVRKQLFDKYGEYDIFSKVDEKTRKVLLDNRDTTIAEYSKIEGNYPKNKKGFIFRWTKESFKDKAEKANKSALKDYDFYYWYLSFMVHSTVIGDVKYFEPSEMPLHSLLFLNIKYILLAFNRWDLEFDLGLGELKKEFANKLGCLKNPIDPSSGI